MRSVMFVSLSLFAACGTQTSSSDDSLAKKCAIAEVAATIGGGDGSPGTLGPADPTDCPVCRDADGKPLPAGDCVAHDYVCKDDPPGTSSLGTKVDHELTVIESADHSPAIAYYGACDGGGGQCEMRDYAYSLYGNEVAVATFSGGVTHVYAIPAGATAVQASEPIFPLLPNSASYANADVHVVFVTDDGDQVEAWGDKQNDCRVTADGGGTDKPDPSVPCWCTQC